MTKGWKHFPKLFLNESKIPGRIECVVFFFCTETNVRAMYRVKACISVAYSLVNACDRFFWVCLYLSTLAVLPITIRCWVVLISIFVFMFVYKSLKSTCRQVHIHTSAYIVICSIGWWWCRWCCCRRDRTYLRAYHSHCQIFFTSFG